MGSSTSSGARERGPSGQRPAAERPTTRRRKPAFSKEHATLWLLTLSLGLGVGAVVRLVEGSNQTAAAGRVAQLAAQQAPSPTYASPGTVPYQSQRVTLLPQRSFGARGTTRMS